MENEHFGTYLRRAREGRALLLSDVAQKTKVARSTLEAMEKGDLALLPAPVYVRGFIRSFARALGVDEASPLSLYERALEKRTAAQEAKESIPTVDPEALTPGGSSADDESMAPRRGLGLAVFVIILLLIATITLSLLLRRPPQSGEGLSLLPPASSARAARSRA
jgi:cytoskeleton protein RodZ